MTDRMLGRAVMLPTRSEYDRVGDLVQDRLVAVEAMYRENLESPVRIVREVGDYVIATEGKRVRPTLHLLCASMARYDGPHDVLLATVLEYIHSATLIHDDIIDGADTRRGRPSVNDRFGNDVTVLFGDYMLAKAMEMALRARSLEIMRMLADVTLRMSEGEMIQTRFVGKYDLTVDEHLDLVDRKTASLFGCCCETAGELADLAEDRREALREYGRSLGYAFQIVDDLLDVTGDAATLGKPVFSDLREGKATLAVLDVLERRPADARPLVERIMTRSDRATEEDIEALRGLLRDEGAIDRARERAARFAERGVGRLEAFPDSPAREALAKLPDLLVRRDH